MWTLVLNSGSSSLKFAVIDPASGETRLSGLAERLGAEAASMRIDSGGARQTHALNGGSYAEAMRLVLAELDALGMRQDVRAVGHRVVHGGSRFSAPAPSRPRCWRPSANAWPSRRCTTRPTSPGSRRP